MIRTFNFATPMVAIFALLHMAGCHPENTSSSARLHFQNESGSALSFLAIDVSEAAVATAENRLPEPLEPNAIYSAVVSRPGNYWVRTEIETEGYVLERIEGPVRITRGVSDWRFDEVDAEPLYVAVEDRVYSGNAAPVLNATAMGQVSAARISFKSN